MWWTNHILDGAGQNDCKGQHGQWLQMWPSSTYGQHINWKESIDQHFRLMTNDDRQHCKGQNDCSTLIRAWSNWWSKVSESSEWLHTRDSMDCRGDPPKLVHCCTVQPLPKYPISLRSGCYRLPVYTLPSNQRSNSQQSRVLAKWWWQWRSNLLQWAAGSRPWL